MDKKKKKRNRSRLNEIVAEIAHDLGFSSVPHLSNQFKKVTGLTITQYLKFRKK